MYQFLCQEVLLAVSYFAEYYFLSVFMRHSTQYVVKSLNTFFLVERLKKTVGGDYLIRRCVDKYKIAFRNLERHLCCKMRCVRKCISTF